MKIGRYPRNAEQTSLERAKHVRKHGVQKRARKTRFGAEIVAHSLRRPDETSKFDGNSEFGVKTPIKAEFRIANSRVGGQTPKRTAKTTKKQYMTANEANVTTSATP